ncbi:peptidoglycan DD-metalloendopeptidase family protein [Billgrantia pellis]|uniref:Peptidoglycan DD-metalloendopeptidase family protein n=1 Tax=Billgrantia pellis TaxID=2606936 RepID=A0A7V7G0E6_9GAMM|nr:peptidoglycan DD-metalloendopeptidase family protein [Halomonas pellis]KAA0012693.1 peptidoglycan DD-metalloendopeptidase family protein [Halomonas pellis]
MRKVLLMTAVALAMAGCAAQQERGAPQIRDLSASRESETAGRYTVEQGDTLYGIAWRHDMDYRDLARLNDISPPYRIQPGQELRLGDAAGASPQERHSPEREGGQVATASALGSSAAGSEGDDWLLPDEEAIERNRRLTVQSLDGERTAPSQTAIAGAESVAGNRSAAASQSDAQSPSSSEAAADTRQEAPGVDAEAAAAAQSEEAPEPAAEAEPDAGTEVAGAPERQPERESQSYTPVEEVSWQWPTDGELVGRFGEGGTITAGIDIAGQKGQPVRAAGPGIVVYAGSGVRGYGNLILLKHNDQYLSAYAHNDTLQVTENDVVEAGEVIATMGDSDAESARLHFEVRKDGQPQDPLQYLPQR